jgi:murein DD-endopeptidase MepM/ murein hydrolase activator NlpD
MYNISYLFIIIALFIPASVSSQSLTEKQSIHYNAPLDIPLLLSANYGEYRSGHFHGGLDFKTQQVEGKNVFAVDSGYVFRIAVLEGSYGNAVYLKHPSGNISVYGHLSRFEPSLASYVKEQQYKKKSYTIDILPEAGLFVFKKGELVGWSGNSGSSFGAHLHFEIRDSTGAVPLNALNMGFDIKDNISPKINWLMVYPMEQESYVNGFHQPLLLPVLGKSNVYSIKPDTILIHGKVGFGIETYDFLNNALNECSPYTMQVLIDNHLSYFCRIDSIPFSEAGYINSFFDYGEMLRSGKKIQKLFIDPNNRLKIYKTAINRGLISFEDDSVHAIRIIATDTYGNESAMRFYLKNSTEFSPFTALKDSLVAAHFTCTKINVFESDRVKVVIPENALFTDIDFQYLEKWNDGAPYSMVHEIHNRFTPLLYSYILSIKPENLPENLKSKALLARINPDGSLSAEGGEFRNGFVTAKTKSFGRFVVTIDTVPPVIKPVRFSPGAKLKKGQTIIFQISDSISGIQNYSGFIDSKWALFEYDAKNRTLSYTADEKYIQTEKNHVFELLITDQKGNVSEYQNTFYY